MSASDNWIVTLVLDGVSLGTWRTSGDFEVSGDSNKLPMPGGGFKSWPGRRSLGTKEFTRVFEVPLVSDQLPFIESRVARGELTGAETLANDNDQADPGAKARRFSGQLIGCTVSGTDKSSRDARIITVVCDVTSVT